MLEAPLTLWREICDLLTNLYKISSDLEFSENIKVIWISVFVLGVNFSQVAIFFQISKHFLFLDFTVLKKN
jgi:hypothetical protein